MTLNSDTESLGNVRLIYTRNNGAPSSYQIGDADGASPTNSSDTVTNAKAATTMTVEVNKFSSGSTLEIGPDTVTPNVSLIVEINGVGVYSEILDSGPLTLNYTFTYNEGDVVVVNGQLTTV
jgi:hypothetical protein